MHLKELISTKLGDTPNDNTSILFQNKTLSLLFQGRHLKDELTIDDYKIERECTIHMKVLMRAGNPETLSIYIPSVYGNITKKDIANTFHRMKIGKVRYVDLVSQNRNDGKIAQNRAFVYFDTIYDTVEANTMKYDLLKNQSVKMHYGKTPHIFWVLVKNKGKSIKYLPMEDYSDDNSELSDVDSVIRPMTIDELDVSSTDSMENVIRDLNTEFDDGDNEDYSMVSADYATQLETELYETRCQYELLYQQYNKLFETGYYP
jgi:hypothetical protein